MIGKMKSSLGSGICGAVARSGARRSGGMLGRQCEEYASRKTVAFGPRTNIPGLAARRRSTLCREQEMVVE
jgi:hypothetical protein